MLKFRETYTWPRIQGDAWDPESTARGKETHAQEKGIDVTPREK